MILNAISDAANFLGIHHMDHTIDHTVHIMIHMTIISMNMSMSEMTH